MVSPQFSLLIILTMQSYKFYRYIYRLSIHTNTNLSLIPRSETTTCAGCDETLYTKRRKNAVIMSRVTYAMIICHTSSNSFTIFLNAHPSVKVTGGIYVGNTNINKPEKLIWLKVIGLHF